MLAKRIMSEVFVWKTSEKGTALIDKYNEQGYISDDDLIELLKEYTLTTHQLGAVSQRVLMGFPGGSNHSIMMTNFVACIRCN
jgi:hypothetical protein